MTPSPSIEVARLLYLLLGLPDSGRREVLLDLVSESSSVILLPEGESDHPIDDKLAKLPSVSLERWRWRDGSFDLASNALQGKDIVFLVTETTIDPVDQIEATKKFVNRWGLTLGRILTIAHCGLAEAHPELHPWHQGCIHFSDAVLLNRREQVSQKWLKEFQDEFRRDYFPCFFEFVKNGRLENPFHVLDPTPRRLSLFFEKDDEALWEDCEEDESGDGGSDFPKEDPYVARYPSGQRCKPLPDPKAILSATKSQSA